MTANEGQQLAALRVGTERRMAAASLYDELRGLEEGQAAALLAEALRDAPPRLAGLRVDIALTCIRGWGEVSACQALAAALVRRAKPKLRELTPGQRESLAGLLHAERRDYDDDLIAEVASRLEAAGSTQAGALVRAGESSALVTAALQTLKRRGRAIYHKENSVGIWSTANVAACDRKAA